MLRKILPLLLAVVALVSTNAADTLTLARKTSLLTIPLQRGSIECQIEAEMPVSGSTALFENLSQRLSAAVAKATGIKNMEKSGTTVSMPALSEMESNFAQHIEAAMRTQQRDAKATGLTLDILMKREYETARLVTFRIEVTYYGLDGKRHIANDRVTLLKSNGKPLTWNDLVNKKQRGKMSKAVARSLFGYFGVMDFINLKNALTDTSVSEANFPLPQNGPAITADGLFIIYAPGEIASEERGQPIGSIKLQSVWSQLTPTAKKLLK